jgi:uncharacterized membrane protein
MPLLKVSEMLLFETDVFAATWLSAHTRNSVIYTDTISKFNVLTSYGLIDYGRFRTLANTTTITEVNSLIYLGYLNTIHEIIIGYSTLWNTSDIYSLLGTQDKIYSNGDCDIYKGSP